MKQLESKYICRYCLSCGQLELKDFEGKMNCKDFIPAYENWQLLRNEYLRREKENGL